MNKDKIIQQGTVAKWLVDISREDFDIDVADFTVTLYGGISPSWSEKIKKEDMEHDSAGYFITLDTTGKIGPVYAECAFTVSDLDENTREITDRQMIGFVVDSACPKFQNGCTCEYNIGVTYAPILQEGYNIHYGAGTSPSDASNVRLVKDYPSGSYAVPVSVAASRIYFLVPTFMTIHGATMSGFLFPLQEPTVVTIGNIEYKCYASANTYDIGTHTIVIS